MNIKIWALAFLISSGAQADTPPPPYAFPDFVTITAASSPYTVRDKANLFIRCDASSGPVIVILPHPANRNYGTDVDLKKIDVSANSCDLQTASPDLIDGQNSWTVYNRWESVTVKSPGTGNLWLVR